MHITDEQKEAARQATLAAIQDLGGPVNAAIALDVPEHRYQTIQSWIRTRVPAEWCPAIEKATQGRFRCEALRPDFDWQTVRDGASRQVAEQGA